MKRSCNSNNQSKFRTPNQSTSPQLADRDDIRSSILSSDNFKENLTQANDISKFNSPQPSRTFISPQSNDYSTPAVPGNRMSND